MKIKLLLICCLLVIVSISCERKIPVNEGHHLSFDFSWADTNDKGTEKKDFYFWVYKGNGPLVKEQHFTSEEEAVLGFHLPEVGEYRVVIATNLMVPFSIEEANSYESLVFNLKDASASPTHAHYGVTDVSVLTNKPSLVSFSLRRVLAELYIEIEGAPEGTTLAAFVNNVADGIYPTQNDDEGDLGRATSGNKNIVSIPKASTVNSAISIQTMRLMPTVAEATRSNSGNSHLRFIFTRADGSTMQCDAQAPMMRSSGKYNLKMKYSELKSYMRIDPIKINDWEEGWIVSGEIFNPEN